MLMGSGHGGLAVGGREPAEDYSRFNGDYGFYFAD